MAATREGSFRLLSGEPKVYVKTGESGTKRAQAFCPECGTQPFAYGVDPKSGNAMAAINVRCLEGVDVAALKRVPFDGRSK